MQAQYTSQSSIQLLSLKVVEVVNPKAKGCRMHGGCE